MLIWTHVLKIYKALDKSWKRLGICLQSLCKSYSQKNRRLARWQSPFLEVDEFSIKHLFEQCFCSKISTSKEKIELISSLKPCSSVSMMSLQLQSATKLAGLSTDLFQKCHGSWFPFVKVPMLFLKSFEQFLIVVPVLKLSVMTQECISIFQFRHTPGKKNVLVKRRNSIFLVMRTT